MRPAQAIKTGFLRSFRFSGRASRSEYWYFLLPGLTLPVVVYSVLCLVLPHLPVTQLLGLSAFALLPLAAVTSRRLADSGTDPADIRLPMAMLTVFLLGLIQCDSLADWFFATLDSADGAFAFGHFFLSGPLVLLAYGTTCAAFLAGLFTGASLFGHMALPSLPGPNRYGPNPSEVLS